MTAPALPLVLVLAAGRGERFMASGGETHKLDAMLAGKPVLQHVLDTVVTSGLPYHVVQPHPLLKGMGDSIAAGVRATANAAGWLVLPGDLPLVTDATLHAVARALTQCNAVVPVHAGQRGHPVGFASVCRSDLQLLAGDQGASSVLRAWNAVELMIDDVGAVADIDTLDDLERAGALLKARH